MNLEDLSRKLQQSGKADKIKQIAQSDAGAKLSGMLDNKAVEKAVRSGDDQALRRMLSQILSTEDGQKLAQSIKQIMDE